MNFQKNKIVKFSEVSKQVRFEGKIDWKINKFSKVCKPKLAIEGSVKSPNLRTENKEFYFSKVNKTYKFYLAILAEPNGSKPGFGIYLINANDETLDLKAKYSLVGKNGSKRLTSCTWKCSPKSSTGPTISTRKAEKSLVEDVLHIRCKFSIINFEVLSEEKNERCQQMMEKMLDNPKFSDFQIICDDHTFNCHKSFLANKSDFFDQMFSENLPDVKENSITIKGFQSQTVKRMLQYIYTNQFYKNKEEDFIELILIADKFKVQGLFDICQQEMSKQINDENVADVINVASKVGATFLKKNGIDFVARNGGTQRWKEVVESNSEISSNHQEIKTEKKKSGLQRIKSIFRRGSYDLEQSS